MSLANAKPPHPEQPSRQPERSLCVRLLALILAAAWMLPAGASAGANAGTTGYYTAVQAATGKTVFEQVCAICHGDHLQGKVGPALAGKQFLSVSQFQGLTAWYLYQFMSTHMPQNAPGSLTKAQYDDLMAFILKTNGYPPGSTELTGNKERLEALKIAPQASTSASSQPPQQ